MYLCLSFCLSFLEDYIQFLPQITKPQVIGLHENAAIGYSAQFARDLWISLLALMPETETVEGQPSAQKLQQVAAASQLEAQPQTTTVTATTTTTGMTAGTETDNSVHRPAAGTETGMPQQQMQITAGQGVEDGPVIRSLATPSVVDSLEQLSTEMSSKISVDNGRSKITYICIFELLQGFAD
ncbi:unnamed protein product [Protopolystoma xenopodis]|uniref:Uncharacterized protein n=1 Tax=Protopolystoma xenopodis TaxID=117903 RepID=A0A448WAI5_9PLAT|nr:unnamed protein product [Protopolystoma xenopodis]